MFCFTLLFLSGFYSAQFLDALRVSTRPAKFSSTALYTRRLSTFHYGLHKNPLLVPSPKRTTAAVFSPPRYPCRLLSLSSIFSRSKPNQTPSPLVVAHITRLEAEANVHPHDVPKQLALFQALADTKLKSSYDLIMNRWERTCEFVRPPLHPRPLYLLQRLF
jgi:ATP-dependent metalloprotease